MIVLQPPPNFPRMRLAALLMVLAALGGCGGARTTTQAPAVPYRLVDCSADSPSCRPIFVIGDRPARTPSFTGYADPTLQHDPAVPGRIWMAYSYLEGRPARGANGEAVGVPVVSTHLARSDDGGKRWTLQGKLWDSPLVRDPEGRGPESFFGSETPSLAALRDAGGTTWYSVRLSYFLEPITGYAPRYATSWTMHVAAARGDSPAALVQAEEAILGTSTTHPAYRAHVRLTELAPELRDCAMWNNPAVTADSGRLYLLAECLVFRGKTLIDERSRVVIFRTAPAGAPPSWKWEYVGVLIDFPLARALGGKRVVSPDVSRGADGERILIVTPQDVSFVGKGCVVLRLDSLDPPRIRRDASGAPLVLARQTSTPTPGWHTGACTHDAASATGTVTVGSNASVRGLQAELLATGLRP